MSLKAQIDKISQNLPSSPALESGLSSESTQLEAGERLKEVVKSNKSLYYLHKGGRRNKLTLSQQKELTQILDKVVA